MRKIFGLLLVAALSFTLSGCAEKWEKPGATEMEFDAVRSVCTSQANLRFPPMMRQVQISNGYMTPEVTNCSGNDHFTNCRTTGGQYVPPSTMAVDDNEAGRNQDVRACLFENGWQPVKD